MTKKTKDNSRLIVGISSCLLGIRVRFDSGHKRDRYITDVLGPYFRFVPVCPEVEVGMPIPREAVGLIGDIDSPRMVGEKSGTDWTEKMHKYIATRVKQLEKDNLSGYILKKDSPSCGMKRVKVYSEHRAERKGQGMYAAALMKHFPLMPVEEEGRLNDARLRDNFIVRVFAYNRLRELFKERFSRKAIVDFHTANKYLLLAHSPGHYKEIGQLVAAVAKISPTEFKKRYSELFMAGLKMRSTTKKNVNVLHHILGFLKKELSADDKKYILQQIDDYQNYLVPLVVPLTLIKHYIHKYDIEYIKNQVYLNPHPKELMLRNHV